MHTLATCHQVVYYFAGYLSPVKLGCEETHIRVERVKTVMVLLKSQDLGIVTVWMISLFPTLF